MAPDTKRSLIVLRRVSLLATITEDRKISWRFSMIHATSCGTMGTKKKLLIEPKTSEIGPKQKNHTTLCIYL